MHLSLVRVDVALLYPPFVSRLVAMLNACEARGARYVATCGFRTIERQLGLYMAFKNGGPRAAPPGFSAHNYGLAVDFVADADPTTPKVEPNWKLPAYNILGEEAKRLGLVWGGDFHDAPHVQWPHFVTRAQLMPMHDFWFQDPTLSREEHLERAWGVVTRVSPAMP